MKSLLFPTLLLTAAVANTSMAAGPYDGIYQYGLSPAYYSVHQNGNVLLIASMGFVSIDPDVRFRVGRYELAPASIGYWDYSTGFITGNHARITGVGLFGACVSTSDVTFDESGGAVATLVSYVNTPLGASQSVSCATVFQDVVGAIGKTITLRRIF